MPICGMFPLGTVLVPGARMPLQIFEPRYRRLLADCLDGDGTFGIVLIERGHEVGGGDTRFGVGTLAHIDAHRARGEGRHDLVVRGTRRIRVAAWLPDAPYPRAEVVDWPDEPVDDPAALTAAYGQVLTKVRRVLALATELGHRVAPVTFDAPDDPAVGSHLLSGLAPVGPLDRQRLLEAPGPDERLEILDGLLDELLSLTRFG